VAYLGSYTDDGLAVADVDPATGGLTITSTVPVPDASWLVRSPDGRFLYATNERSDGAVTALNAATLAVINREGTHGAEPTHVSVHPDGRYLLVANYGSGSVAVLPLDSDGGIGPIADLQKHIDQDGQPHAHQVLTDPSGDWVLAVDLGNESVYVYRLDTDTGQLRQHSKVIMENGTGPRHLVFHPDGAHAYLVCENLSQAVVFGWDAERGALSVGQIVDTVTSDAVTPNHPAEGVLSSDGRFLYVTNRGDNSVATFAVEQDGEALALLATSPTGGDWPRHAALDPTERWLYVSNQRSGTVTRLPRDPDTGALSPSAGSTDVPDVAVVLF
jgi:6-phosphogluconolactonase (cycloisomerase 2 family)